MKDIAVNNSTIQDFFEEIVKEIDEHGTVICSSQPANTGKWGMARLWRAWMSTTADFMSQNGVTMPLMINADGVSYAKRPFNADDAHELFTRQHLGVDEKGERISWAKSGGKRKATKGERFDALRRHEMWASDRGITLFKPRGSEYQKLIDKQEV